MATGKQAALYEEKNLRMVNECDRFMQNIGHLQDCKTSFRASVFVFARAI